MSRADINRDGKPSNEQGVAHQKMITLGLQHHNAGRLSDAKSTYNNVLHANPDHPVAMHYLGVIAYQTGSADLAVELIEKSIAISPDDPEAHCNLGTSLQSLGRHADAIKCYRRAIDLNSGYYEAHNNLGNAYNASGKLDRAEVSYKKALSINPQYAEAHSNLSALLVSCGQDLEAEKHARTALSINPANATAHNNLAAALMALNQPDKSADSCREALALRPNFSKAHSNLGKALMAMGQLDAAADSYRQAIIISPELGEAHMLLATSRKFTKKDGDLEAMEHAYALSDIDTSSKAQIAFGLGKVFEDLAEYETAFKYFLSANSMRQNPRPFSLSRERKRFEKIERCFASDLFQKHPDGGVPNETPIFILGMPRSGTTLVEQILSSHPEVHGAGEVPHLGNVVLSHFGGINSPGFEKIIKKADASAFAGGGQEYIDLIRSDSDHSKFISDKMPGNFLRIGMIKLMLPRAKIVHCCRNPLDTCLSIFKTYFAEEGTHYAYDLEHLGQYYSLYRNLMEYWHRVFPDEIFDIHYEDIVSDQEGATRTLLSHCGLEWDAACEKFNESDRQVFTASTAQVRQPIYGSSIQSWKRYENYLAPLINALKT